MNNNDIKFIKSLFRVLKYGSPVMEENYNVSSKIATLYTCSVADACNRPLWGKNLPVVDNSIEDSIDLRLKDGKVHIRQMNTFLGERNYTDTLDLKKVEKWKKWINLSPEEKYGKKKVKWN